MVPHEFLEPGLPLGYFTGRNHVGSYFLAYPVITHTHYM